MAARCCCVDSHAHARGKQQVAPLVRKPRGLLLSQAYAPPRISTHLPVFWQLPHDSLQALQPLPSLKQQAEVVLKHQLHLLVT